MTKFVIITEKTNFLLSVGFIGVSYTRYVIVYTSTRVYARIPTVRRRDNGYDIHITGRGNTSDLDMMTVVSPLAEVIEEVRHPLSTTPSRCQRRVAPSGDYRRRSLQAPYL